MSEQIATEMKAAIAEFKSKTSEMDKFISEGNLKLQGVDTQTKETIAKMESLATEVKDAAQRVADLEQKTAESIRKDEVKLVTVGEQLAASESIRAFNSGNAQKGRVEIKNTITSSDATTAPDRQPGIIPGSTRLLRLLDVVPTAQTSLNVIETTREASYTDNAAETAEGNEKPESAITFELVTTNIRTFATWLKVSKQVAADAPMLATYINNRLMHKIQNKIDSQIINGDGTAPAISGITDSGNYTAFSPTTGEGALDSIARAIAAVSGRDYNPTAVILNTADFWAIQRAKGTTNDHYLYANPASSLGQTIWGLPVVATNQLASGKLIVADFTQSYQFWMRESVAITLSDSDDDNFTKNLVTVLAEARGALETRVPAGCSYGNLTA